MNAQFPREDESIQDTSRNSHPFRNTILVALFVALAGFGFFRDDLTSTDSPTVVQPPTSTVNADLLSAQTDTDVGTLSVADIAEAANPAVVTIYNLQAVAPSDSPFGSGRQDSEDDDSESSGQLQAVASGSGWIYDNEGHVVTNAHVVAGAEGVEVLFYDGSTAQATVVGTDQVQDVAVLQLELGSGQELPGVATVGDSSVLRAGEEVIAIGSPLGEFTNSVSDGIIGGLDRSLDTGTGGSLANLIQHDAPISSGNSGGPLLNRNGEVIGMNVARIDTAGQQQVTASGLNFAIDGNTVVDKVSQIIRDGEVVYPYLGVETQQTDAGTTVVNVVPEGPADTAGIESGDVIVAVGGEDIGRNAELTQLLYNHDAGDSVDFEIERDGETQTITVALGERPSSLN